LADSSPSQTEPATKSGDVEPLVEESELVQVSFDYDAQGDQELTLKKGEIVQ